jgi:hypothetical protein
MLIPRFVKIRFIDATGGSDEAAKFKSLPVTL